MVILVVTKPNSNSVLTLTLREDKDIEVVRQITDRLAVYLEPGVKFEYKAT